MAHILAACTDGRRARTRLGPGRRWQGSSLTGSPSAVLGIIAVSAALLGCKKDELPAAVVRPVRTVVVVRRPVDEPVVLTGQIQAQEEVSLAFRTGGRVIERSVDVGATVRADTVVARLDPRPGEDSLHSAEASLSAAMAQLVQARNTFDRQTTLLASGFTTRSQYDQAQQQFQSAQSQVDADQAQLRTAQDRLAYADLHADAAGVITAKGVEPGEIVETGQMVVKMARAGGLDAVFDVPAALIRAAPRDVPVTLALTDDPRVQAKGRVREVAPQADAVTRTYRVKVALIDPPAPMRLGATVTGSVRLASKPAVVVPATALTQADGQPAVWVVEPASKLVALRSVAVARYEQASVVLGEGVEPGELVVTAGVHALHPGQVVRLLGDAP